MQTFRQKKRFLGGGIGQKYNKFISPITRGQIDLSGVGKHAFRDRGEDRVPGRVAVGIVDALEVVDVQDHERKLAMRTFSPVELFFQALPEIAQEVEAGQPVGDGELFDPLEQAGNS